jgi:hypothetical protein
MVRVQTLKMGVEFFQALVRWRPGALFTGFECTDTILVFHENVDLAHVEERQVEGVIDETVNLLF